MEVLKALKNMKSFLVTLLTVAMVFGSVPSVAFGAEELGNNEPETAETEEIITDGAANGFAEEPTEMPEEAGSTEGIDPVNSYRDVNVWISKVSGTGDAVKVASNFKVYPDGVASGALTGELTFDNDNFVNTNTSDNGGAVRSDATHPEGADADDTAWQTADSENDYSFYVEATNGHQWPTDAASKLYKVWYGNYNTTLYNDETAGKYIPTSIKDDKIIDVTSNVSVAKVDWDSTNTLRKVTISSTILKDAKAKSLCKDLEETYTKPIIIVQLADFEDADLASGVIAPFTYTNNDEDTNNSIKTTARTAKYIATATGAAAKKIVNVQKSVKGNVTLSPEMITVKWTEANGTSHVYTGSSVAIDNENLDLTADTGKVVQYTAAENGTLNIAAKLINKFVTEGGEMSVNINTAVEPAGSTVFRLISDYDDNYAVMAKDAAFATAMPTTITKANQAFTFYVKVADDDKAPVRGVRKIKEVTAETLNGKEFDCTPGANGLYTIAGTDVNQIDSTLVISVTTYESLYSTGETVKNAVLYSLEGDVLASTDVESGEPLVFDARAAAGYKITKVAYNIGDDQNLDTATVINRSGDGFYHTAEVTDGLTIHVVTEENTTKYTVQDVSEASLSSNNYKGTVFDDAGTTLPTSPEELKYKDEPYVFTVFTKPGYDIESVAVAYGNSESFTELDYPASVRVSPSTGNKPGTYTVFKTDATKNEAVRIKVVTSPSVEVVGPKNRKVSVDVIDEILDSTVASRTEPFYFTLTPESSDVTISKVEWKEYTSSDVLVPSDNRVLEKQADGRYKIPKTADATHGGLNEVAAGNYIQLEVKTVEVVKSGFTAAFAVDGETTATLHPTLVNTYAPDGTTITAQKLHLIYGESTDINGGDGYLTAVFKNAKGDTIGTADTFATTLGEADSPEANALVNKTYSTSTLETKNIVEINDDAAQAWVYGNHIGKDVITAQITATDPTDSDNTLVYRKELEAEVTNAYENLHLAVTTDTYAAGTNDRNIAAIQTVKNDGTTTYANTTLNIATFTLVGTNTRTGDVDTLYNGNNGIVIDGWRFDPDNSTHNPKTALMKVADNGGTDFKFSTAAASPTKSTIENTENDGNYGVEVGATTPQSLKVVASVKQKGETKFRDVSQSVKVVEAKRYLGYPTVEVRNGAKTEGNTDVATLIAAGVDLESDPSPEAMNGATITLDLYADVKAEQDTAIDTADDLEDAIDFGYVSKVAPTYTATVKNVLADPKKPDTTEYISVKDEGNGKFTVTAKKELSAKVTEVDVTITARMNDVIVDERIIPFDVTSNLAKQTVYLKLDNAANKDSKNKVVQQTLTGTYYTGRAHSIVEDSTNYPLSNLKDRGIKFTKESNGGVFVLPTQADFDATKVGTDYSLIAWQHGNSGDYYRPGGKYTVDSTDLHQNTFTAIWALKYDWPTDEKGTNVPAAEKNNGLAFYSGHAAVTDEEGETTYGDAFSVMDDASPLASATGKLGKISAGGNVPVVLKVNEYRALSVKETEDYNPGSQFANYLSETDLLNAVAKPIYATEGITLTSEDANYSEVVSFEGTKIKAVSTGTTNVRASWNKLKTVPINVEIVEAPNYTLTLADASIQAEEVQNTKSPKQMTATLKDGTKTIEAASIGKYKWTWTSDNTDVADVKMDETANSGNKADIIAKKPGTANISVVAKDASGIEATLKKAAVLTVTDSGVKINVLKGTEVVTAIDAVLNTDSLGGPVESEYSVTEGNKKSGVTFNTLIADKTGDGKVVAETGSAVGSGDKILIKTVKDPDKDEYKLSDKGEFYVFYKYGGTQFRKVVPVSTYFDITLDAQTNNIITKNGAEYKVDGKNVQTVKVKVPFSTQNETVKEEIDGTKTYKYTYTNISLDGYQGEYNATAVKKSFRGWQDSVPTTYTASIAGPLRSTSIGATGDSLLSGAYTLNADYGLVDITKVTTANDTITLVNDTNPDKGAVNWATVKFDVEPADTTQLLMMVPDKVDFYSANEYIPVTGDTPVTADYIDTTTTAGVRTDSITFNTSTPNNN